MKALISTTEVFNVSWISSWTQDPTTQQYKPVYSEIIDCQRIAEVVSDDKTFEVYETLIWVNCSDECQADQWYYKDGQCFVKPEGVPKPTTPQPQVSENGEPGVIA